jgi:beta-mannosidase
VQSGEIIWMGNEPFPNNTNSSMIEADGTTKPVYHWAQECFAPVRISAKYNAIAFKSGDIFMADIYVSTSRKLDKSAAVMTEILDLDGNTLESFGWPVDLEEGSHNAVPNKVEWTIPKIKGGIFFLRLELTEKGIPVSQNTYLYTVDGEQWFSPLRKMPAAKVASSDCGDGCLSLTNTSASAALGVFVYGADPDQFLRITPNYLILMPDETKYLTVEVTRGAKEADIRIETYNGTTDTIRMKGI